MKIIIDNTQAGKKLTAVCLCNSEVKENGQQQKSNFKITDIPSR